MKRGLFIALLLVMMLGCTGGAKKAKTSSTKRGKKAVKLTKVKLKRKIILPEKRERDENYPNYLMVYSASEKYGQIVPRQLKAFMTNELKLKPVLVKDTEVTQEQLENNDIMVLGNTKNNRIIEQLSKHIPYYSDGEKIVFNDKVFSEKESGVTYVYPNLYNTEKDMVIISGNSSIAEKAYDFSVYDFLITKGVGDVSALGYIPKVGGHFDKNWKLTNLRTFNESDFDSGENDKLEVGEITEYEYPKWVKGKVMYEIFVRSFYDTNGDGVGDLKGVLKSLDYLQELGVDILWLMPIFDAKSYHGYDVRDYFKVKPEYGTNEDLSNLAKEMHKRGMYLLVDMTFNHGSAHLAEYKDARGNADSKYDRWFYFTDAENTICHNWYFRDDPSHRSRLNPYMPAWNTNNIDVINYHEKIMKHWLDPNGDNDFSDGLDGFRFDYARGPSHDYWKILRQKMKKINPESLILGELWIDYDQMYNFFDNQFDTAFDFSLQGVLNTNNAIEYHKILGKQEKKKIKNGFITRFIDNHDFDRMASIAKDMELYRLYSTLIFTVPGVPKLYYGNEIGMKGTRESTDRDVRRPMEWYKDNKGDGFTTWFDPYSKEVDGISVEEQKNDPDSLYNYFKKLIKIRKENSEIFFDGDYTKLTVSIEKDGKMKKTNRVYAYVISKGNEKIINILNIEGDMKFYINFDGFDIVNEKYIDQLYNEKELEINKNYAEIDLKFKKAYIFKIK